MSYPDLTPGLSSCPEDVVLGIAVAEKEHWKERIGERIGRRIETLVAKQDPTLLQRVAEQAWANALEADILAESGLGKQVLALREEKDNLLDTVWPQHPAARSKKSRSR